MNEQRNGSTQMLFFYQDFPGIQRQRSSHFMDKISFLDFQSPWPPGVIQEPVRTDTGEYKEKQSAALYKIMDPSILDIPVGHYGGRGFIYRDRVPGEGQRTLIAASHRMKP